MESVSGNSFELLNVLPHCNLGSFESNNFCTDPQICKNDKMDIWTLISRQNNILQQQQIQISQLTVHLTALQDLVKSLSSELKALKPTTDTVKLHIASEPVNLTKKYNNEFHPCNLFCHWCKGYYHTNRPVTGVKENVSGDGKGPSGLDSSSYKLLVICI